MSNKSKFDDWSDVKDCLDCQHYWNDSCDGTPVGYTRPCTDFLASKSVDIPIQIKSLRKALRLVYGGLLIVALILALHLMGWL